MHLQNPAWLSMVQRMTRRVNGAAVRAIREALGISQVSLARRVQVTKSHMSMVEAGLTGASPEVARRIASELGVSYDAITNSAPEEVPA